MLPPITAIEDPDRQADAIALDKLFRATTGFEPRLWGEKIGYGQYHYRYASGREGSWLATGFGIGKREFSIYILPGYSDYAHIAARLGPHRHGRSCWYIRRLSDINGDVLRELIEAGLADLGKTWKVEES